MTRPAQRSMAGVACALGGFVIIGGCLLPWLDTGGVNIGKQVVSGRPVGMETSAGDVALVSGALVLLAATLMLLVPRAANVWALAVLLAGVVGMIAALPTLSDPRGAYVHFVADDLGRDVSEVENSLNALFDIGGIRAGLGEGVYVTLAGGGLSVIAGAAGLVARRRRRRFRARAVDHVEPSAEVESEPTEAVPEPASEQVATETAPAVASEKGEQAATRPVEPDEQPAPAAEKTREKAPPSSDVDEWR